MKLFLYVHFYKLGGRAEGRKRGLNLRLYLTRVK